MKTATKNENIEKIITADHSDPFSILGLHKINQLDGCTFVIRAYYPDCSKVTILIDKKTYPMDKIDSRGFFELFFHDKDDFFSYKLKITDNTGHSFTTHDPYCFPQIISDFDLSLFSEGNHDKIYNHLGAHQKKINNVAGTHFAVWAPNAKRVSVVGDFNQWDGRRHQCRLTNNSGVWEIFIPLVQKNDLYKFEIKTQSGEILLKSDPYAYYSEKAPSTASIVYDLDNYVWNDGTFIQQRDNSNHYKNQYLSMKSILVHG